MPGFRHLGRYLITGIETPPWCKMDRHIGYALGDRASRRPRRLLRPTWSTAANSSLFSAAERACKTAALWWRFRYQSILRVAERDHFDGMIGERHKIRRRVLEDETHQAVASEHWMQAQSLQQPQSYVDEAP